MQRMQCVRGFITMICVIGHTCRTQCTPKSNQTKRRSDKQSVPISLFYRINFVCFASGPHDNESADLRSKWSGSKTSSSVGGIMIIIIISLLETPTQQRCVWRGVCDIHTLVALIGYLNLSIKNIDCSNLWAQRHKVHRDCDYNATWACGAHARSARCPGFGYN